MKSNFFGRWDPRSVFGFAVGSALAVALALVALLVGSAQRQLLGHPPIEPIVLALLFGMVVRQFASVPAWLIPGVKFASRPVLNASIVLLGASVDLGEIAAGGTAILFLATLVVLLGLGSAVVVGRVLRLPGRLPVLVGVGNAICGNSAIAAAAPAVGATHTEVATAVSFTAVLGLIQVLLLPLLGSFTGMSDYQYGVLAGLTVYSVPQVVAASFSQGQLSGEVAMLTKLTRVLFLGPVVLSLSLLYRRERQQGPRRLTSLLPPFIIGFILLALVNTTVGFPGAATTLFREASSYLFLISMAALGLEVDLRSMRDSAGRVVLATALSMGFIMLLSGAGVVTAVFPS